ncbi:hypothetical protein ES703_76242 [subsurface metagenome]
MRRIYLIASAIAILVLSSRAQPPAAVPASETTPPVEASLPAPAAPPAPAPMTIDTDRQYLATIETEKGNLGLELFASDVTGKITTPGKAGRLPGGFSLSS